MQNFSINREMLQTARKQFCLDTCLDWQQYLEHPNQKVYIQKTRYAEGTTFPALEGARCYGETDAFFKAIMCMGQLFLSVDAQIYDWAVEQFTDCAPEWFCEYGNLRKIDEKLQEYGRQIKDTHVYYLPAALCKQRKAGKEVQSESVNPESAKASIHVTCEKFVWYEQNELLRFKEDNRFTRALSFWSNQPDVLAVAAMKECVSQGCEGELQSCAGKDFDQSHMSGMAGASADGQYLWQIGINVVPESAGKGLAVELVKQLKEEIIRRGKVPFYGTSESHTISQTVGLKSGFVPAWTEIYAKGIEK